MKALNISIVLFCFVACNSQKSKTGDEQTEVPNYPRYAENTTTPADAPIVGINPADLTSAVGNSPLSVQIYNQGKPVDEALLKAVASAVRLVRLSDGQRVEVATSINNPTEEVVDGYNKFTPATVVVTPKNKLTDDWYELRLTSVPSGVAIPQAGPVRSIEGGIGARFAIGSRPIISNIQLCAAKGVPTKLVVRFSERLSHEDLIGSIQTEGDASGCTLVQAGLNATSTADTLGFSCDGLKADAPVTVRVTAPVTSADGGVLTEQVLEVTSDSWKPWAECSIHYFSPNLGE